MANTVNAALKPLETLSRIVNQPSNLFGSKGCSNKNKTEHDTAGAARDSNSNTQDQGIPILNLAHTMVWFTEDTADYLVIKHCHICDRPPT